MARFATIGPVKAGWLVKSKGHWYVTEEGKKAYNQIQDPAQFNREARRLYLQWRASQPEAITEFEEGGSEGTGPLEKAAEASTVEEAEETAWAEIEQYVQAINPYDLQKLVAALLRAMGYHVSWIAPPGQIRELISSRITILLARAHRASKCRSSVEQTKSVLMTSVRSWPS